MGFLSDFDHDAFVSYAHSGLDAWSKGFVEQLQQTVARVLGPEPHQALNFWMDTEIEGNYPLSENLKHRVQRSACIIVLMTERYLKSDWCNREADWFNRTVNDKILNLSLPVFIVRLDGAERRSWPESLRSHDLPGYNFVGDLELKEPVGFHGEGESPRGEDYHRALRQIARDMIRHIRALKQRETKQPPSLDGGIPGERGPAGTTVTKLPPPLSLAGTSQTAAEATASPAKRRLYLAAVPEDVLKLRRELAAHLSPHFEIVPAENPRDPRTIRDQAAGCISGCEFCVAVLGGSSGIWGEDEDGFVLYQQRLFGKWRKQTFNYRSSKIGDVADLEPAPYRDFIGQLQPAPTTDLAEFALQIIEAPPPQCQRRPTAASVYLVSDGDHALERQVRDLLSQLQVVAVPLGLEARTSRELADLSRDDAIKEFVKLSDAILLLNGLGKSQDNIAIHRKAGTIYVRFAPEFGHRRAIAIVDGPPDPRLGHSPPFQIFKTEASNFQDQIRHWLATVTSPVSGVAP